MTLHIDQSQDKDAIDTPSIEYVRMAEKWPLLEALREGTEAMRKGPDKWLPKNPKESDEMYNGRKSRTFLTPAFDDSIRTMVSKPFRKNVVVSDDVPEELEILESNTDREGKGLTELAADMLEAGNVYGLTHVLIDHPAIPFNATKAEEAQLGARPFFIHIPPPNLIGWRTEVIDGQRKLVDIRIFEKRIVPDGEFSEREVAFIRRYTRTQVFLYELITNKESGKQEWMLIEEQDHSFGEVPLVTYYINRTGHLTASPPHQNLAELNLAHWQSSSDQRNITHFIRVPILALTGFTDEDLKTALVIGVASTVVSSNEAAKIAYVEHTGRAVEAGQKDLDKLRDEMSQLGLNPRLMNQTGDIKATGQAISESRANSVIMRAVRDLEAAIIMMYEAAAKWRKIELPETFSVKIFDDFTIGIRSTQDLDFLLKSVIASKLDLETFLKEIQRRGTLSEDADLEVIMNSIAAEGPALALLGEDDNNDDENQNVNANTEGGTNGQAQPASATSA